jgi:hypothetical protein
MVLYLMTKYRVYRVEQLVNGTWAVFDDSNTEIDRFGERIDAIRCRDESESALEAMLGQTLQEWTDILNDNI